MKRSAAILEWNKKTNKEEWRIINNPTIGDIRNLRQKGAIIMRQIIERNRNEINKYWITDSGRVVVQTTEYLCSCRCCH
jgi:hypothetical protein